MYKNKISNKKTLIWSQTSWELYPFLSYLPDPAPDEFKIDASFYVILIPPPLCCLNIFFPISIGMYLCLIICWILYFNNTAISMKK